MTSLDGPDFETALDEFVGTLSEAHAEQTPPGDASMEALFDWIVDAAEDASEDAFLRDATNLVSLLAEGYPGQIGEAIRSLTPLLEHENVLVRRNVARAIGYVAAHRSDAILPVLSTLLSNLEADDALRRHLTWTLSSIARTHPDVVAPELDRILPLLEAHDRVTANHAARCVTAVASYDSTAADRAIPALLALVEQEETSREAGRALAAVADADQATVRDGLFRLLETGPTTHRANAAWAIATVTKDHPTVFAAHVDGLVSVMHETEDHRVVEHVSGALRNLAASDPGRCLQAARRLLDHEDVVLRRQACLLLGEIALHDHDVGAEASLRTVAETDDAAAVRDLASTLVAELQTESPQNQDP